MATQTLKPGDRVTAPWPPGTVTGTILYFLGDVAEVAMEFPTDEELPVRVLPVRVALLQPAA